MKLKQTILLFGLTAFITSCAEKREGEQKTTLLSNFLSITDNEDKGVKEILDFYGGQCKYAVGASASTTSGKSKYFELEMSQSEAIERYSKIPQMPASNVAYLFYKNLKDEKNNYDEIHTVLKLNDGDEMTFKYPIEQLDIVACRMQTVEKVVELIKSKQFHEIKTLLNDTSVANYYKNELVTNLENIDSQLGELQMFLPYGFRINETEEGKRYLHISGAIFRDKQNHEFSADFDLDRAKEELLMIGYKL
ncbi:hypothetical protein SAMN05216474_0352 [Lishizhenia tianjinensis]|uniref:Lipoprotein n=1 Tax=Lishizhenia tianjinensis TaxID=477690 RepID=A0A1I6XP72_9FLAO|nr:hypothetical protein [Lishizhenia tianjinensis]SFT40070.1 hypothetical protein SAMN05216474_0352 [Lishizhenia tianjinensis]